MTNRKSRWDKDLIQRETGLRLAKLKAAGVPLGKRALSLAKKFSSRVYDVDEHRDEFLAWIGEARWGAPEECAPTELIGKTAKDIAAAVDTEKIDPEGFEGLTTLNPKKCLQALKRLARSKKWPSLYWQRYLWTLSALRREQKPPPEHRAALTEDLATTLSKAPTQLFLEVGSTAGDFIEHLAKSYDISRESEISILWNRAWEGIGHDASVGTDDVLTQALNHMAGKLAEAALTRMWKYSPKANAGIPSPIRPYFDAIVTDPDGHLGRIMLTTQLYQLYAIDPDWTSRNLISRLSPATSDEAHDLWSAYGWSPRVGPNLLAAFKAPFLEILVQSDALERREQNLVNLFMAICLEARKELTPEEIHRVVQHLSKTGLRTVIYELKNRLDAAKEKREIVWDEKVAPWLKAYWPQSADKNSDGTTDEFVSLLCAAGRRFPQAVSWALPYLMPVKDHIHYELKKSKMPETYPDETFKLVKRIVPPSGVERWEESQLKEVLDILKSKRPSLGANPEYQALYRIATGQGTAKK